jgi:hypothetical protein
MYAYETSSLDKHMWNESLSRSSAKNSLTSSIKHFVVAAIKLNFLVVNFSILDNSFKSQEIPSSVNDTFSIRRLRVFFINITTSINQYIACEPNRYDRSRLRVDKDMHFFFLRVRTIVLLSFLFDENCLLSSRSLTFANSFCDSCQS